ncbi:MAG: hypothetical protein IBJ00_05935, partial [Alphaproteobacteria bacterium]|nr:hypothetical protein [Alphaproteobacteria bacterium]
IDLTNVIIIYTSDHGQNLLHDGQPITHCRRTQPDINEAIVPLLIFTHNLAAFKKFKKAAQLNFNKASHFQIYPTLLTLFGYDLQQVKDKYGKSLFEAVEKPLGFTSGPIFSPFGHTQSLIWNKDSRIKRTK